MKLKVTKKPFKVVTTIAKTLNMKNHMALKK
jgi:hypothetical protein